MSQKAPTLRHWKGIDTIGSFQRRYAKPRFSALHMFESNAFIREKFPYRHRLFMDNDPKHTSVPTKDFLFTNGINHVETPAQSPVSIFNIKLKKN